MHTGPFSAFDLENGTEPSFKPQQYLDYTNTLDLLLNLGDSAAEIFSTSDSVKISCEEPET